MPAVRGGENLVIEICFRNPSGSDQGEAPWDQFAYASTEAVEHKHALSSLSHIDT